MDNVTVIPMTNAALQAVTTPYVSFEHPFEDRVGRFERQLDAFSRCMGFVILTDTWPDALFDSLNLTATRKAVDALSEEAAVSSKAVWPETAIYKTSVAKLYEIDERIKYRPHMHFLCQIRDEITGRWQYECAMSPEAAITVPDRGVYTLDDPPPVTLAPQQVKVTCVMLIDHLTMLDVASIRSWQTQTEKSSELIAVLCGADKDKLRGAINAATKVIDAGDVAPGAAFNRALSEASGEYIAYWDPSATYRDDRLQAQLQSASDVSMVLGGQGKLIMHGHSCAAGKPERHDNSLVFHRRVFEKLGGVYPSLPIGFLRDKFFHAQTIHELTFELVRLPLVEYSYERLPYGYSYTQQVLNDIFRRRFSKDREFHAWALFTRR